MAWAESALNSSPPSFQDILKSIWTLFSIIFMM
jgi:hypothetical protein